MDRDNYLKRVLVVPVVLVLALLVGCSATESGNRPQQESAGESYPQDQAQPEAYPAEDGDTGESDEQMVIRTKTIRLEVESTEDSVNAVRELTRDVSGTVTDMQVATDDGWVHRSEGDGAAMRGWVTVRVPTDSYEDYLVSIMELGTVQYQSETSEDVTQKHVDLSARLENLRAQEARLREFFEAAQTVEEMLAIEQELGRVRGEIESLDAQITYLERQAAMATVTIELTEPRPVVAPQGPSWGFVEAITDGFRGAATLLTGVITLVIATSPLWLLGLVLFFPIRAIVRKRRARAEEAGRQPKPSILTTVPVPATGPGQSRGPAPAPKPKSPASPPKDA